MPESPRWLIAQNRREEAKSLINKASKASPDITMTTSVASNIEEEETKQESKNIRERLHEDIKGFWVVVSNSELRKRLLITNFTWMTASLTYYALGNRTIQIYFLKKKNTRTFPTERIISRNKSFVSSRRSSKI